MSCSFVEVSSVRVDVGCASSPLVLAPAIAPMCRSSVNSNTAHLDKAATCRDVVRARARAVLPTVPAVTPSTLF